MSSKRTVLLVQVSSRAENAMRVQHVLTEWGRTIKTRLGLHDPAAGAAESSLIILELCASQAEGEKLGKELSAIGGVETKLVTMG